jgi:hypothetical protein
LIANLFFVPGPARPQQSKDGLESSGGGSKTFGSLASIKNLTSRNKMVMINGTLQEIEVCATPPDTPPLSLSLSGHVYTWDLACSFKS